MNSNVPPNGLVYLPKVPNFPPYDNESPVQYTDPNGFYAYMVYPNTDYYLTITKDGYEDYKSVDITVYWDIVEHSACLQPINSNGTGIIAVECGGTIPQAEEPKPTRPSGGGGGGSWSPTPELVTPEVTPEESINPVTPIPTPEPPVTTPEEPPVVIPEVTPEKVEDPTNSLDEQEKIDQDINTDGLKTNFERSEDESTALGQGGNKTSTTIKTSDVSGKQGAKPKLPQTNGETQTTMIFVGFLLVIASMFAFFIRRRKQM